MTKDKDLDVLAERVNALEKRMSKLEGVGHPVSTSITGPKPSMREFLISKKPEGDVKKTLAVVYHLEKFGGHTTVGIAEVEAAFDLAKEKKPLNTNDKINMCIRNGHMEEVPEKKNNRKAWSLTDSGRTFVENNFKK